MFHGRQALNINFNGNDMIDPAAIPGKKISKFAKYYIITGNQGTKYGNCRLCVTKKVVIKMTRSNTSGLKRHLRNFHPDQYFEIFV